MKQVLNFVKLFLVILLVSLTSCTNDLSEKDSQMSFSFTLPQEKVIRTTGNNNESTLWNVTAVIENKKDIIQKIEQSGYSGETVTITFNEILVGQKVRINIDLTQDGETTPSYTGSSDWFFVKKDENKINIKLSKVEIILPVDAALPTINTSPKSIVEIATSSSKETITKTLSVNATSTDGGTLSFIWQEKNENNKWTHYTPITTTTDNNNTTCSINVTVNKGQDRTFRCIITNTNNSVNGNITATIETDEVTVAYVEGTLSEITAQYTGGYEIFESRPYGKVKVTETYTSGSNTTKVTVTAVDSRYTISPTNNNEKAIGYVPYTVKNNTGYGNITTEIRVPVKYQLSAGDFVITSTTNEIGNSTSSNPEKIAQFTGNTTLEVKTSATSNIPDKIYENSSSDSENYIILDNLQSEWKQDGTSIQTPITVNNTTETSYSYINTLTVPTENSWCFGDPIELEYYVQVCPWTIELQSTDGNNVELANLTGGTNYTLSATNEAYFYSDVTWSSNNTSFTISNNQLTTPEATTSDQTATITAKVVGIEIGSVEVTVQKQEPLGSERNPFTTWEQLKDYLYETTEDESTIYVKGNLDATETAYTYRPVTIIPVGEVTITRTSENTSYIFYVYDDLTLKGSQNAKFVLQGIQENSYALIYCTSTSDTTQLNLEYCTLQKAKKTIHVKNDNSNVQINNCIFTQTQNTDNDADLYLYKAGEVSIYNTLFDETSTGYNIYTYQVPSLTLSGQLSIPKLYFYNDYGDSQLGIYIGDNLSLINTNTITIYAENYINNARDCEFFDLTNGQTLPEGVFALGVENYTLNPDGKITEANTSGGVTADPLVGVSVPGDYNSIQDAINDGQSTIIISENIEIDSCINITKSVQIGANSDVTITSKIISDNLFYVENENFILGGGSGTLKIVAEDATWALIAGDSQTKTITIKDGVKFDKCNYYCLSLTNNYNTVNIEGGIFTNNKKAPIYIENPNVIVNITRGEISNNSASSDGAGIILKKGQLNITGGTIKDNSVSGVNKGASIYVTNGTVNINGTTYTNTITQNIIDGVLQ